MRLFRARRSGLRALPALTLLSVACSFVPSPGADASSTWRLAFRDDFNGTTLNSDRWSAYDGIAKTGGQWSPANVQVSGGVLTLVGARTGGRSGAWQSAGIGNRRGLVQTYGKYRVRMKIDNVYGLSYAALLYPEGNSSPPEVDVAEGFGRTQQRTKATVHSGTASNHVRQGQTLNVDMTRWHTFAVEWTPRSLRFFVDNREWWRVTGSTVPSSPMVLDLQSQIHGCDQPTWACPTASAPARMNVHIDWVEAYSYRPLSVG